MKRIMAVAGLVLMVGCQAPTAEMTEAETAQIEAEVSEELSGRLAFYRDALLRGDMDAFMSIYTSDTRVNWTGANFPRDGLQAFMEEYFQTVTLTEYDAQFMDLFVHGDAAYVIYEVSETFQAEGQEPESAIWNCFTRWEKEDGIWMIDRDVCGPRDAPPEEG